MTPIEVAAFNSLFAVAVAIALWCMPAGRTWARSAAALLLIALTANYTVWRAGSLPPPALNMHAIWPLMFFAFELVAIGYETWTTAVMTRTSDHSSEADRHEAMLRRLAQLPTVDVFIATYNEDVEHVLRPTVRAAVALEYPEDRLTIWLNDDGDRAEAKALAQAFDISYLARPDVLGPDGQIEKSGGKGKGGNDRNAFTASRGEYIVLVDADFQLDPNFLFRTVGFLEFRPDVGLVQTPQRFVNGDVIGHNLGAAGLVPDDQHFFMDVTQAARDVRRNAFCTGTACVVSRAGLEKVDPVWGFPNQTITEDLELSYALVNVGLRTVYLNEPLAYGLAPTKIAEFLKQRVRWCTGTIQNIFAPTGPIRGHLSLIDRLFYLEGTFYWLGSIFMVLLILAPLVFWTTGIPAVTGAPDAAVETLLPRLIARELIVYWLSGGTVPPLIVYLSKSIPAFHVSAALLKTLVLPGSGVFKVTSKETSDEYAMHWPLFVMFSAIAAVTSIAMMAALVGRSSVVADSDSLELNVVWSVISVIACVMCALACVDCPHPPLDRQQEVTRSKPMAIAGALALRWLGIRRGESQ